MGMIPRCEAGHNSVNFYLIQHKSYHKYILWGRQNLYIVILFNSCKTNCRRRVAQFGRALRSDVEVASSNLVTPIYLWMYLNSYRLYYFGARA